MKKSEDFDFEMDFSCNSKFVLCSPFYSDLWFFHKIYEIHIICPKYVYESSIIINSWWLNAHDLVIIIIIGFD